MEDNTKLPVNLADIQDQIKKLQDMLNEKYAKLNEDVKHFELEKEMFDSTHKILMTFKDPIKLNIGGKIFMTSRSTLMKEDSMLKSMFSGRHELEVIKIARFRRILIEEFNNIHATNSNNNRINLKLILSNNMIFTFLF